MKFKAVISSLLCTILSTACATDVTNTFVRFSLALSGPGQANQRLRLDKFPDDQCVFNLQVKYPGSTGPSKVIPRRCANLSSVTVGSMLAFKEPFHFKWDASPNGPSLERTLNLGDYLTPKELEAGRINFVFKPTGVELWFQKATWGGANCGISFCHVTPWVLLKSE